MECKWRLRPPGRIGPQYRDLDPLKALFTVKMCFWGEIIDKEYVGGSWEYVDFCRIDLLKMSDLAEMAMEMGFHGAFTFYHFCEQRGIREIVVDHDIKNIGPYMPTDRVVIVILTYIEALSVAPPVSKCVNLETDDDEEEHVSEGDYFSQPDENEFENSSAARDGDSDEHLEPDAMANKMPGARFGGEDAPIWPEFNPKTNMSEPVFQLGMLFSNNKIFKEAVLNYAVNNGRGHIYVAKNESTRVRFKCAEGCPWKITAMKMQYENTLQVKRFTDIHTCVRKPHNKHVKAAWLANRFLQDFRRQPNMACKTFVDLVWNTLVLKISVSQALRARQKAVKMIEGVLAEQYPKLFNYVLELKKRNPGTTAEIVTEPGTLASGAPVFKRIYICLGGLKEGFKHCRPIIGVDGTHLKSANGGVLLTAVGIDSNNNMYPLAYAVVESETKDSWTWFLELLRDDVEVVNETGWTFISDKQKGLLAAFEDVIPNAEFRFCFQHLHLNFSNSGHKGMQLRELLWNCASATNMRRFKQHMKILHDTDEGASNWLNDKPPNQWSKSHFSPYPKCDLVCNNLCESFNGLISKAREMPILTMLEDIREFLMTRIVRNRTLRKKWWGRLCPSALEKLEQGKKKSGECIVSDSSDTEFQVKSMWGDQYTVDLDAWGCSCRKWDLTGIPCHHAIASIFFMYKQPEAYVNDLYKIETYDKIYQHSIAPMTHSDCWYHFKNPVLLPPHYHKLPGRPKKCRRKNRDEPKPVPAGSLGKRHQLSLRCSICKVVRHNSRHHKSDNVAQPEHTDSHPQQKRQKLNVRRKTSSGPIFCQQEEQTQDFESAPGVTQFSQSQPAKSNPRLNEFDAGPAVSQSSQPQPAQKKSRLNLHQSVGGFHGPRTRSTSSNPNPRGWLATGNPQTTTSYEGTPLIVKGGKKFVSLSNLERAMKASNKTTGQASTGKSTNKKRQKE